MRSGADSGLSCNVGIKYGVYTDDQLNSNWIGSLLQTCFHFRVRRRNKWTTASARNDKSHSNFAFDFTDSKDTHSTLAYWCWSQETYHQKIFGGEPSRTWNGDSGKGTEKLGEWCLERTNPRAWDLMAGGRLQKAKAFEIAIGRAKIARCDNCST